MKHRALITGCAGFVGRRLWRHLADEGWDVRGCDREIALAAGAGPWDALEVSACDIASAESVDGLLEWAGPVTHVFHLAAMTFVPDAMNSPLVSFNANLLGTVALADAARARIPDARFVFVGSSEVYGPPRYLPQDEQHPLNPGNPYAISKAAADQYCDYAHKAFGQDIVRLRPFNHSGPGQSPAFVLSSFARQIAHIERGLREPVLRVGNLDVARDFSHVDDIVRAYALAALGAASGEAYNVCSGEARPLRYIVERFIAHARTPVRVETDPARLRPVDNPEVRGCHDKLTKAVGWQPARALDELLDNLMAYWREAAVG